MFGCKNPVAAHLLHGQQTLKNQWAAALSYIFYFFLGSMAEN
jgi:hypothetical protein